MSKESHEKTTNFRLGVAYMLVIGVVEGTAYNDYVADFDWTVTSIHY